MHKRFYVFLMLLVTLSIPLIVSAQETTPEPTIEATAEVLSEAMVVPDIEAAPSNNNTYLRVAHFSPDAPSVDVYFNGNLAITGLTYLNASAWIPLEPASYSVAIVSSGGAATDAVIAPFDVSASAGTWQTIAILGSAANNTLQGALIGEDYSDLLPGTGGFTFLNALEGSSPVNLMRNDVVYYAQIAYPAPNSTAASSSLRVDSGLYTVAVIATNDPANILFEQTELEIPENAYTMLALVGTPGNEGLVLLLTDESDVEIARGLLPKPGTLTDSLRSSDNLIGFANALGSGELASLLSETGGAEYTIFAPASFVMDGIDMSEAALNGYIVAGKFTSTAIINAGTLTALDGSTLTITTADNGIYVNGTLVIDVNIAATNGVIHMLNGTFPPAS